MRNYHRQTNATKTEKCHVTLISNDLTVTTAKKKTGNNRIHIVTGGRPFSGRENKKYKFIISNIIPESLCANTN